MRTPARLLAIALALSFASSADAYGYRRPRAVYGAIAYDRASGAHGYAYDYQTERAASVAALEQCARRECEVLVSFRNGCGAIADGPVKKPVIAKGATPQEVETRVMKTCGSGCRLVAWACTK